MRHRVAQRVELVAPVTNFTWPRALEPTYGGFVFSYVHDKLLHETHGDKGHEKQQPVSSEKFSMLEEQDEQGRDGIQGVDWKTSRKPWSVQPQDCGCGTIVPYGCYGGKYP